MTSFEQVWNRIRAHQRETFHQIRGGEFTYEVSGSSVHPDRTNRALPKSDFRKAYAMVPLEDTTAVQHLQGPSYIYAILMDARISDGDW